MPPKLVTFDCAGTLVEAKWRAGEFAVSCAGQAGLSLGDGAAAAYGQLIRERHDEYLQINVERDHPKCEAFWSRLTRDWLEGLGEDPAAWQPQIEAIADRAGFSESSTIFRVYEDVRPCLDRLRAEGARLAILSNWDYSLHKVLRAMRLDGHFELVVASLEHGFEKPDPRIFHLALDHFGVAPAEAAHVGDDVLDDLGGARDAGMLAVLIDRAREPNPPPPLVSSLEELPQRLGWNG